MSLHESTVELDVSIEYTFTPEEKEVRYYAGRMGGLPNGDGHPGCPAKVEIDRVWLEKNGERIDIADFLPDSLIESLEEQILNESCQLD